MTSAHAVTCTKCSQICKQFFPAVVLQCKYWRKLDPEIRALHKRAENPSVLRASIARLTDPEVLADLRVLELEHRPAPRKTYMAVICERLEVLRDWKEVL